MATDRDGVLLRRLRATVALPATDGLGDGDLVTRFATERDEAAFATLVRRHGPMVFGVARRLLGTRADVEDVFQATFLVLARKAAGLRCRDSVGNWLYGVAVRLARRARSEAARRQAHESQARRFARSSSVPADPSAELSLREAEEALDAELSRLPEKYRAPLVLCCLEGQARDEAARQLGWTTSLLKSRLEQARELLHQRLVRRGLSLGGVLAAGLVAEARAAVTPRELVRMAVRALDPSATTAVGTPAGVLALTEGGSRVLPLTCRVAVLTLVASLCAMAGLLLAPPKMAATPRPGSAMAAGTAAENADSVAAVSGTVVDEKGNPVAGATITAPSHRKGHPTTSAADGTFRLALDPTTRDWYSAVLLARGQDGRLGLASADQEKPGPIRLVLKPAREFVARVTDGQGRPVADAEIFFVAEYRALARGQSDSGGRWTGRVPADAKEWSVFARKAGVGFDYVNARVSQSRGDALQPLPDQLPLVLDGVTRLRVRTVDQTGKPLAGVRVGPDVVQSPDRGMYLNLTGTSEFWPVTDKDGSAVLDWLPKRFQFALSIMPMCDDHYASDRSTVLLAAKPVEEMTITLLPFDQLAGRVVNADGRPAAGVYVAAWGFGAGSNNCQKIARTDADGRYQMQVFSEQAYVVSASDGERVAPYRSGILVRIGKPVRGVDFVLGRAARVYGRVTMGKEKQPAPDVLIVANTVGGQIPDELRRPGDMQYRPVQMYFNYQADSDGRFDFRLGPGVYEIRGPARTHTAKITIPAENPPAEIVHDFWMPGPATGSLAGRVVDAAGTPVAGALVEGRYTRAKIGGWFPELKTDNNGRFATERSLDPLVLHAMTADRRCGGVVRIEAEEAKTEIVVRALATASGRLLDLKGRPLPAKELLYGIRVWTEEPNKGPWSDSFGGNATSNAAGRFTLTGLVPGETYHLNLSLGDGQRKVTEVRPNEASPIELGDVSVDPEPTPPYVPPTPAQRTDAAFKATRWIIPRKRLERVLAESRREYTRPLLLFGRPEDPACVDLFRLFHVEPPNTDAAAAAKDQPPGLNALRWGFELATFDTDRPEVVQLAGELKVAAGPGSAPVLVVLESDGTVTETYPLRLDDKKQIDGTAAAAFLARYKPVTRDAEEMLREGQQRAKAEGKRVFFIASTSWCGSCRRLSQYLASQREELERHYVFVKVDISRDRHGDACRVWIKGNEEGGVPWYAILDGEGKAIISSDAPEVANETGSPNIGYPYSPAAIEHFMKMLRQTAPRLSAERLAALQKALAEKK